jgi:phage terminase large subunit GpA-like protein
LADLERWLFEDVYTTEDGAALPVWRAGMDTGGGEGEAGEATMTEQVYGWLRARGRGRVFGIKGASRRLAGGKKMLMSLIDRMPSGRALPGGIRLWLLDTDLLKDAIWSRIESGQFFLHAGAGEDYARHLAAEAKERDARGRTAWVVQGARANHLLDCEVYAAAMADPECWGGLLVLPRQPGPGAGDQGAGEGEVNPFTGRGRGEWLR